MNKRELVLHYLKEFKFFSKVKSKSKISPVTTCTFRIKIVNLWSQGYNSSEATQNKQNNTPDQHYLTPRTGNQQLCFLVPHVLWMLKRKILFCPQWKANSPLPNSSNTTVFQKPFGNSIQVDILHWKRIIFMDLVVMEETLLCTLSNCKVPPALLSLEWVTGYLSQDAQPLDKWNVPWAKGPRGFTFVRRRGKDKKTWKVHAWISKTLADWKVKLIWRRSLCDRTVSSFVKGSWANNKLINRFINPGCGFRKVREELTNVLKFWYHQWEVGAEKYNLFCCDIVLSNMRNILRYFKEFNLKSYQMSHSEFFLLWQLHENILRMIFLKTFLVKNSPGSLGGDLLHLLAGCNRAQINRFEQCPSSTEWNR